jgi:molybdopterin-binding protein
MKISARNQIKGTIKKIIPGSVNTEILIAIADGTEIVSIITKESADRMDLSEGKDVFAVVKASNVMIAVED